MKIFYVCALNILDKRFSAPTAEGRILDHGFTKEGIPYIYMLPWKSWKDQNWSCSRSKLFTIFYLPNLAFSTRA